MVDLEKRKKRIIGKIGRLESDFSLRQIERILNDMYERFETSKNVIKPLKEDLNVDEMAKDQDFTGIDRLQFNMLIKDIDIQEPFDLKIIDYQEGNKK